MFFFQLRVNRIFFEQLKQFEEDKITAEELLDVVLNSSTQASDSKQLLPGDLVMVMKAMNTAVSNMNAKQRMSAAKVKEALWFSFVVHLTLVTVQSTFCSL